MAKKDRTTRVIESALAFVLGVALWATGGKIEGALFPVVSRAEIGSTMPVGYVATRVSGTFTKYRNCEFRAIEATYSGPGGQVAVLVLFEEGTKVRTEGAEDFGPWVFQATEAQMPAVSAVVLHRCHWLWLTETEFL